MPGFYAAGEYDLAGFIVGVVDREQVVDGKRLEAGDRLIGLPSNGLHTNGYSLARKIVFDAQGLGVTDRISELGLSVADALLAVHRSYLPVIEPLLAERGLVRGLAHITGGGITDNLPRIFPPGLGAVIRRGAWQVPPLFRFLEAAGGVPADDMYRTFNMGIGLIVACAPADEAAVLQRLRSAGETRAAVIGEMVTGDRRVRYA